MHDWNRDGKEDYWDDIYFLETFERNNGIADDEEDDDYDEYTGIRSNRTYNQSYSSNRYKSTGVPFIVRLIIVSVVASIIGAFNEILGAIVVIIWGYIEFMTR